MTTTMIRMLAGGATAALLACGPAQAAGITRAWVSGHGTDGAGCGAPNNPCRSLQYTHDNIIAPGGEVDILDPAGYGAITITKAISIVNDGVGTAGVQQATAGQNAITINAAATDSVTLRGLNIDGLGVARDGIGLTEAGRLTVINCVVRHFANDGVHLQQNSGPLVISVLSTIAADNAKDGFEIAPGSAGGTFGVIDHSDALDNAMDGVAASGVDAAATSLVVIVTASNSNLSNNGHAGIYVKGIGSVNVALIAQDDLSDDSTYGYYIDAHAGLYLSRSEALFDKTDGVFLNTGGIGYTFGDNKINTIEGTLLTLSPA